MMTMLRKNSQVPFGIEHATDQPDVAVDLAEGVRELNKVATLLACAVLLASRSNAEGEAMNPGSDRFG